MTVVRRTQVTPKELDNELEELLEDLNSKNIVRISKNDFTIMAIKELISKYRVQQE